MDQSNGYEQIATAFITYRGQNAYGIGASSVRKWAQGLLPGATVLDLGCGTGIPVSKVLIDEGMTVYGVDASPSLVNAFKQNFTDAPVACEPVEHSLFFNRKFDAIIAWGLLFLLPEKTQASIILKAAKALRTGGKFLFTAPDVEAAWNDVMTGQRSVSLGSDRYKALLAEAGLSLVNEFEDEGENHYYDAVRV
ncbi:class I SAM-dependent methyltransferase [Fulvivirgaceae bacterium PWU4]|uniref:Class I SAM-dependent methyltransferase n=1 Tax=Chryseosolibacter histidini TaxID=2782349 RepID=A0AAP2DPZ5_9BACT|nr:class I SAM-dependent methyltransferase [Chryseosolibacter histidini]MBT1700368.1 class I SAM-dependent methyltransferase [Chryseosolibacter histidini]